MVSPLCFLSLAMSFTTIDANAGKRWDARVSSASRRFLIGLGGFGLGLRRHSWYIQVQGCTLNTVGETCDEKCDEAI